MSTDPSNTRFQLALQYVQHTGRHIFLTGRAGTGKTTFLKQVRDSTFKKLAIVAPTGVAAINAGGVTIHSFFQIPPGLFLPGIRHEWGTSEQSIQTTQSLTRNLKLSQPKREILQELELLIIDEVSMVRADTLDAIDTVLRFVRRQPHKPFGGVQVLFIGDLFQLPPVVNDSDWELLKNHYNSPFFFDAQAIRQSPLVYLELQKIYRQSDDHFIRLLNAVRNNVADYDDLETLNQYFAPNFKPPIDDFYITLTTHNAKADLINNRALSDLPGKLVHFNAQIEGEFPEKGFPADNRLSLKTGAQVMFIKNDKGESRRYYNGKIATVSRIDDEKKIFVRFDESDDELELELETWRNIRYNFDKEKDRIEEEELGAFKQYPIRLAWAITIHKSQGLTFKKAIIDAGESFSPGQVYVALSRMTDLSGMVLRSRILPQSIQTDERVLTFSQQQFEDDDMLAELKVEQANYVRNTLIQAFDLEKIHRLFMEHEEAVGSRLMPDDNSAGEWAREMLQKIQAQKDIAEKFIMQLSKLLQGDDDEPHSKLLERSIAAVNYFNSQLSEWKKNIEAQIVFFKTRKKAKKYLHVLTDLFKLLQRKDKLLAQSLELTKGLASGMDLENLLTLAEKQYSPIVLVANEEIKQIKSKTETKEASSLTSLKLFKSGNSIPDIALQRNLVISTIYGHLTDYISSGEIDILDLVQPDKFQVILEALESQTEPGLKAIKESLGEEYGYHEIRAVSIFRQSLADEKIARAETK
jgi:ATP-dependent exoDNAse (exonuclease V) alpha subunit